MNDAIFEFYDESQIPILIEYFSVILPKSKIVSANTNHGLHKIDFQSDVKIFRFLNHDPKWKSQGDPFELIITNDMVTWVGSDLVGKLTNEELKSFLISNMRGEKINKIL